MPELALRPGSSLGLYPQRRGSGARRQRVDPATRGPRGHRSNPQRSVDLVMRHDPVLQDHDDRTLDAIVRELRARLMRHGLDDALVVQAFAVVREVAGRTLGMRHRNDQLAAGWLMLQGKFVEMPIGNGKTFATALPVCTAALAGIPVHVVTARDALAERDWAQLRPLYQRLGLTSSPVVAGMAADMRRDAYAADITHTTGRHLASDYLRDRFEMGEYSGHLQLQLRQIHARLTGENNRTLLLRGLCFAIIDEADSVLVDQANVPAALDEPPGDGHLPPGSDDGIAAVSDASSPTDPPVEGDRSARSVASDGPASLSHPRFFGRYLHLGGTASTLTEVAAELDRIYGVEVIAPARRRRPTRSRISIYPDPSAMQGGLLARVVALKPTGQPLLICARSASEARQVGAWLDQKRIGHRIVEQSPEQGKAILVSGQPGAITVVAATAIAATSIAFDEAASAGVGLQLIAIGLPDSARVERRLCQFVGAGSGSGSAETILCLQDDALCRFYPRVVLELIARGRRSGTPLGGLAARLLLRGALGARERTRRRRRVALLEAEPDSV